MSTSTQNTTTLENILHLYTLDRTPSTETIKLLIKIIRIFTNDTGIDDASEISKHSLNLWKQELLQRTRSTTCNSYIRQLKSLILFAVEEELITENPFLKFRMAKEASHQFKSISQTNIVQLISVLESTENKLNPSWFWITVIRTLYYTGIRRRQLIGLTWNDINFEKQTILLQSKYSKTLREWVIPLHDDIYEELLILKKRNQQKYGNSDISLKDAQVFNVTLYNPKYFRKKMTEEQLSGFFRNLSRNTKIKCSAHRFRHRLATDLVNQKGNIKDVQHLLGHSNVKTTLGYVSTDLHQMRTTLKTTTPIHPRKPRISLVPDEPTPPANR
jgi:integrase